MILVFASSKGGVGKSTTCAALGSALTLDGASVLIIDLDPNRTVERWSRKIDIEGLSVAAIAPAEFTTYLSEQMGAGTYDHILIDLMGNHIILLALRENGFRVEDADMIEDGRRLRGKAQPNGQM